MAKKKRRPTLTAARAAKLVKDLTRPSNKLVQSMVSRQLDDIGRMTILRGLIVVEADIESIKKMIAQ